MDTTSSPASAMQVTHSAGSHTVREAQQRTSRRAHRHHHHLSDAGSYGHNYSNSNNVGNDDVSSEVTPTTPSATVINLTSPHSRVSYSAPSTPPNTDSAYGDTPTTGTFLPSGYKSRRLGLESSNSNNMSSGRNGSEDGHSDSEKHYGGSAGANYTGRRRMSSATSPLSNGIHPQMYIDAIDTSHQNINSSKEKSEWFARDYQGPDSVDTSSKVRGGFFSAKRATHSNKIFPVLNRFFLYFMIRIRSIILKFGKIRFNTAIILVPCFFFILLIYPYCRYVSDEMVITESVDNPLSGILGKSKVVLHQGRQSNQHEKNLNIDDINNLKHVIGKSATKDRHRSSETLKKTKYDDKLESTVDISLFKFQSSNEPLDSTGNYYLSGDSSTIKQENFGNNFNASLDFAWITPYLKSLKNISNSNVDDDLLKPADRTKDTTTPKKTKKSKVKPDFVLDLLNPSKIHDTCTLYLHLLDNYINSDSEFNIDILSFRDMTDEDEDAEDDNYTNNGESKGSEAEDDDETFVVFDAVDISRKSQRNNGLFTKFMTNINHFFSPVIKFTTVVSWLHEGAKSKKIVVSTNTRNSASMFVKQVTHLKRMSRYWNIYRYNDIFNKKDAIKMAPGEDQYFDGDITAYLQLVRLFDRCFLYEPLTYKDDYVKNNGNLITKYLMPNKHFVNAINNVKHSNNTQLKPKTKAGENVDTKEEESNRDSLKRKRDPQLIFRSDEEEDNVNPLENPLMRIDKNKEIKANSGESASLDSSKLNTEYQSPLVSGEGLEDLYKNVPEANLKSFINLHEILFPWFSTTWSNKRNNVLEIKDLEKFTESWNYLINLDGFSPAKHKKKLLRKLKQMTIEERKIEVANNLINYKDHLEGIELSSSVTSHITESVISLQDKVTFWDVNRSYKGRGIAISIADKFVKLTCAFLESLREVGTDIPIEFIHRGDLSMEAHLMLMRSATRYMDRIVSYDGASVTDDGVNEEQLKREPAPQLRLRFVNIKNFISDRYDKAIAGFNNKFLASVFSTFDDILLVDSDSVFMVKPELIFEEPGFQKTNALFFVDRTVPFILHNNGGRKIRDWLPSQFENRSFGIPYDKDHALDNNYFNHNVASQMESGVVAIRKSNHLMGLIVPIQISWSEPVYTRFYGDKELFWLGQSMMGNEHFTYNPYAAGAAGKFDRVAVDYDDPDYDVIVEGPGAVSEPSRYMYDADGIKKFTMRRICSSHPGHLNHNGTVMLWINSGFYDCKFPFKKTLNVYNEFVDNNVWKGRLSFGKESQKYYDMTRRFQEAKIHSYGTITDMEGLIIPAPLVGARMANKVNPDGNCSPQISDSDEALSKTVTSLNIGINNGDVKQKNIDISVNGKGTNIDPYSKYDFCPVYSTDFYSLSQKQVKAVWKNLKYCNAYIWCAREYTIVSDGIVEDAVDNNNVIDLEPLLAPNNVKNIVNSRVNFKTFSPPELTLQEKRRNFLTNVMNSKTAKSFVLEFDSITKARYKRISKIWDLGYRSNHNPGSEDEDE